MSSVPSTALATWLYPRRYERQAARLMAGVRRLFSYQADDNRAAGYLDIDDLWIAHIADDLLDLLNVRFTHLAFQAYRDGNTGTDWHADSTFDEQAIVSLGATRTIGLRRCDGVEEYLSLQAGDLLHMPPGFQNTWEHRIVPQPDVTDERIALVFRVPT